MSTLSLKMSLLVAALWLPLPAYAAKNILVFGDSLSAGYGIAIETSWVNLMQRELQRSHSTFNIVNASISGETTAGGKQRVAGAIRQHRPSIVIIELGANDGLRGFEPADIEANLSAIIEQAQRTKAKVLLIGMELPPNYGAAYTKKFRDLYPRLAKKYNVVLLPFLLAGISPDQFQPDNLHPVANAQPHIMHNVMQTLKPLLH